jgi:formate-dependent nitrite reductase cytochrome c552 subunit
MITRGELYHYHHGIFDGSGVSYKVCVDCDTLRDRVDEGVAEDHERTPFEGLVETCQNRHEDKIAYVKIRYKRGASLAPWMRALLEAGQ